MDVEKVLAELREQRDRINEAILVFERLARSIERRPGRPPKQLTAIAAKRRGWPPGSGNKGERESGGTPTDTLK